MKTEKNKLSAQEEEILGILKLFSAFAFSGRIVSSAYLTKSSSELRRVINSLRKKGFLIASSPRKGYWLTNDIEELSATIEWFKRKAEGHYTVAKMLSNAVGKIGIKKLKFKNK